MIFMTGSKITVALSVIPMLLGVILIMPLEPKIYVGTYSGSFTVNIDRNGAWSFKYARHTRLQGEAGKLGERSHDNPF